ncbi:MULTISPECIES: transcription termination/antitermination NusG family protein [Methylobacterium]|nr:MULTISPECIES: transcription termination/antitermination NusG family protein [Methylobacterium]
MSRRSIALAQAAGEATDAPVLPATPALRLGDRCRWPRDSRRETAMAQAAGEPNPVRWHAAVTNPGCEVMVRDAMARRGVDTVLPMLRFWRVRNRKRIIAERPLMARILVFGLDRSTQHIAGIYGLERIVRGASDRWAVLAQGEVEDLRLRILRGEFDATLRQTDPQMEVPPLIRHLVSIGALPYSATCTHKAARNLGLKFKDVA